MANLAKTQAEWTAMFREFGGFLKIIADLEYSKRRYAEVSEWPVENLEPSNWLTKWTLTNVRIGFNTDAFGIIYGKLLNDNPGAGSAKIELYMDSARTVKVAEGSAVKGNVITVAPVSTYEVGGTVKTNAAISGDELAWSLVVFQDFQRLYKHLFAETPGGEEAVAAWLEIVNATEDNLSSLYDAAIDATETYITTRMREFLNSTTTDVINISLDPDENGNLIATYTGLLYELIDAMDDELTAAKQTVLKNTASASAVTADADNIGQGTPTVSDVKQYVRPGTVIMRCTDETIGSEQFEVTERVSQDNSIESAENDLVVKTDFRTATLGFKCNIQRIITEYNDGSNQLSTWVINGETDANTDDGNLYVKLYSTGGGMYTVCELYSASSRAADTLVASGTILGASGTITFAEQNSSSLTGSVLCAFTIADSDIYIDLNVFKLNDEFRFNLLNDEAGLLEQMVGRIWGIELPSATSGAETITDGVVVEGINVLRLQHVM